MKTNAMKTNTMKTNTTLTKRIKRGFTLIEVIAVLVLLGILAAIAVPKYVDMAASARQTAIDAGIAELNSREALVWGELLLTNGSAASATADMDIGVDYVVTTTLITFDDDATAAVTRAGASDTAPALWTRTVVVP